MGWVTWCCLLAPVLGPLPPTAAALPSAISVGAEGPVTAAPAPLVLTLPDALKLGLARDRAVRIGQLDAVTARAAETQAYAAYQPSIDLLGNYSTFDSASAGFASGAAGASISHNVSVRVEQMIFDTAQALYGIYRTRQEARAAEQRELEAQLTAAKRIAADFYEVLRTGSLERLAEQVLAQSRRELELARARAAQGSGARLDVTRAEVAVANSQVELSSAGGDRRTALSKLRYDLLLPPGTPLDVSDAWLVPAVEESLAEALVAARADRPQIAAAQATSRARQHALTAARLRRWATVNVNANYQKFFESSRDVTSEYQITAAVTIPLFDGQAGEAAETAAEAAYLRAGEQFQQQLETASLEVEQAHLSWTTASERLVAAEAAARLAAATLSQTEESYRLGVASLLELAASRTEYSRAESNRIQAKVDRDLASINLRVAVGRLPLPTANQGESR
ncbi:MAG: TolC family protein [Fimbriimonadaceae bacterium]|nr:TolC family protein [Fimbriimonadaceae bacterium]